MQAWRVPIRLSTEERSTLEHWERAGKTEQRMVLRARVVLLAEEGLFNRQIARRLGCDRRTVRKWRTRFVRRRLEGLQDAPRSGRPVEISPLQRHSVLVRACQMPSLQGREGQSHWSLRDLTENLKDPPAGWDLSLSSVYRILDAAQLKPHRIEYWKDPDDPEFEAKMFPIIDLYVHPPKDRLVICLDEKPGMQAIERLFVHPVAPGKLARSSFEYRRHGTVDLLAALNITTGEIFGHCYAHHRHEEFLDFLDRLDTHFDHPKMDIILDNLKVHTHDEVKTWLRFRKERVTFHFLPVHGSWLNQIELWFGILQRKCLNRGSVVSRQALEEQVLAFIETYNREDAHPFRWTYKGYPLAA